MTTIDHASLIAEARERVTFGSDLDPMDADRILTELSDALEAAEQERDNWKMSAEEAERAEKRWKDRAVEAERERDRLDEAFDRDLPWRYDEVEAQRNQYAAVVEKVRVVIERESGWFRYRAEPVSTVLAAVPADALREHDAALIEGLADEFAARLPDGTGNGRAYNSHTVARMLREKARQRREGQS